MNIFHLALGLSAMSAAGGMNQMGAGSVLAGQAAALDAISRAVVAGVIPPPPKAPPPPPPPVSIWGGNSLMRQNWQIARRAHEEAMWQFEHDVKHWQHIVATTFGKKGSW